MVSAHLERDATEQKGLNQSPGGICRGSVPEGPGAKGEKWACSEADGKDGRGKEKVLGVDGASGRIKVVNQRGGKTREGHLHGGEKTRRGT